MECFCFQKYILSLIKGVYDEVGFSDRPNDEMLTIYKRIDVINIACLMEYVDCVKQAVTNFHNWMMAPNPDAYNPYEIFSMNLDDLKFDLVNWYFFFNLILSRISPNLRNTVYCTAVRVGGAEQWHFIRERFAHARSGSERDLLLTALGCTRLPWLLIRFIVFTILN